ncbi:hypothetical protein QNI19_38575 [Cytophagaceae bacterium DM2B3-1]|uniref:PH domain-containing protein n=2 Tax=Xanthocytophaga flava TaxID=3048013 RepID=A0ABT7CYS0_9BACT|nr:hypothetical protein [Xanthocytophaga flavus]MDJ1473699.1 hypothetical protein [Xanthocytophaga flavus]MDJ1498897.1 hypothetical protein [Xanthocytophaga flavus]
MSENDIYRFAVVVLAINLILWFLVGYYLNYPEYSDSELLVSNDVWFWKEKRYVFKDIKTVSLYKVSSGRGSKSIVLEVNTSYGADTHYVNRIDRDPAAIARFIDILNKKGIVAKAELDK